MSAPPYMKLYVADYLGDTHHLSAIEHGAYMLLLMGMWRAGGTLPAADANLSRLARCTPPEWEAVKAAILPFFKRSRGKLTHKRITSEMAKYETVSRHRSEAGKAGAAKKAQKDSELAQANAGGLPTKPEPEPEPTQKEDKLLSVTRGRGFDFEAWWSLYPNAVAKPVARKAYAAALAKIGGGDPGAVLLDGLRRSLASPRWNDPTHTRPNPARWLDEERWNDREPTGPPPAPAAVPSAMSPALIAARRALLEQTPETLNA